MPLHFNNVNNAQDQTTTASAVPPPPTHLNYEDTESAPVNDDCDKILKETLKEITELSSGKELPANHGDLGNACENLYDLNVDVTGDAPGLV